MSAGDALAQRVEAVRLAPRVQLPAKVKPGTRCESQISIASNVMAVYPTRNMPVYRYDVRVLEEYPPRKDGKPGMKEVTKQTREDYLSIDRKNKCVAVYKKILERESKFFGKMSSFVYDRASILYSLDQLKIGAEETKTFFVKPAELPENMRSEECVRIHFNIKKCSEDFELSVQDFSSGVSARPDEINRSVQQFYELLVSQEAFFTEGLFVSYGTGESYLLNPENHGFTDRDMPELGEGKYVGIGASKGVRILEGPANQGLTMGVLIDVKKAAFHIDEQDLPSKVSAILKTRVGQQLNNFQVKEISKLLKGLYVRCNYGKHRSFGISAVSAENAETLKFKRDNKLISVVEYFQQVYKIRLQYPVLPVVTEKTPKGLNYYPMECLSVCENQRVTLTQQSAQQVQLMIRACATAPVYRMKQSWNLTQALKLGGGGATNRWIKEMQMKISEKNVTVPARVLPMPSVRYAGQPIKVKPNASWTIGPEKYLMPAVCQRWYAAALCSANDTLNDGKFREYIQYFLGRCRQRGMQMGDPVGVKCLRNARITDVDVIFKEATSAKATFIHFVTSENLKFHDRMKFMESQNQICTQDLMSKTALVAGKKPLTLDNIVHKTNLKLGGFNFELRLDDRAQPFIGRLDRVVIGIDLAFTAARKGSTQARIPTVVGYSCNSRKHPLDFIGGYRYAYSQMEELDEDDVTIRDIVAEALRGVKQNRTTAQNGGVVPMHIFVLRDGISEGQYKYVVEREVEQIKKACALVGGDKYRPHITVLVATKKHNMRLYRQDLQQRSGGNATEQNIPPGTVVDKEIVNPVLTEFYLNSHSAFQGTTKTPRYNLVCDTSKMSADEMQAVVHALTFNLQIVSQACSLPAPIMIADQMASRGRNNYNARFGESSGSGDNLQYDLAHLNENLTYTNKELAKVRFNA